MNEPDEKLIEGLRASKQAALAEAYADGQNCGRSWVEVDHMWRELTRLVKFRDQQRLEHNWELLFDSDDPAWAYGEMLYQVMTRSSDRNEAAEFWESLGVSEEEQCDGEFMRGFAERAIDRFESVEPNV